MEEQRIVEKKEKKKKGSIFIVAGLFIGLGIGFILDKIPAGIFIGLGIGFAAYGISLFLEK